jgi:WD40 repeat protein
VSEGVPVIQLPWVAASFRQIAFQPNGDLIAISAYQSIVIWSVETQQQLSRIKFDFTPQVIMFTPDGQRLVILDEPNSFVWKLDTRQDIVVVHDEPLPAGFTRLWPRQPRPERVAALVEEQNWSDSHLESAAMGPQGESIAVGWVLVRRGPDGSKAGLVTIVDLSSGLETAVLEGSKAGVSDLVFHPSGDYLATSGSEPFVRLWDLTEQVQIGSLAVDSPPGGGLDYHPTREVLALGDHPVFSPTGELLASISAPLLWTDPFQVGRASDTPIFSGQKPPWDGERGINLWDAHTFIQRGTLTPGADDLAFSSEGDILGSVDGGGSLMLHGAVEAVTDDINAPVVLADIIVNVDPPPPDSTGGDGPALPDSSAGNDSTSSDSTASVYPNPFTESLTVSFKAPGSAGSTHVAVFDVLGRRVRILAGGAQAPSSSTITWDGRDDTGRPVAAGVYLILLRDEHDTDVLKVVRIN